MWLSGVDFPYFIHGLSSLERGWDRANLWHSWNQPQALKSHWKTHWNCDILGKKFHSFSTISPLSRRRKLWCFRWRLSKFFSKISPLVPTEERNHDVLEWISHVFFQNFPLDTTEKGNCDFWGQIFKLLPKFPSYGPPRGGIVISGGVFSII